MVDNFKYVPTQQESSFLFLRNEEKMAADAPLTNTGKEYLCEFAIYKWTTLATAVQLSRPSWQFHRHWHGFLDCTELPVDIEGLWQSFSSVRSPGTVTITFVVVFHIEDWTCYIRNARQALCSRVVPPTKSENIWGQGLAQMPRVALNSLHSKQVLNLALLLSVELIPFCST